MRIWKRLGVPVVAVSLLGPGMALAGQLEDLLPNLFGEGGIRLVPAPGPFSHEPHFTVSSEAQLNVINDSLKGQLSNIPLPSPASGFSFRFDPALGALVRATESFGPIYAQRADTTGRNKFTFGLHYSRFTFDKLDGKNLDNGDLQVTFLHEDLPVNDPFVDLFERETITGRIKAEIDSDVVVVSATYGVLDNLDVSLALPIIHTRIKLRGTATINRVPGVPPTLHVFPNGTDTLNVSAEDDSTGVGDLVIRGKYNFLNTQWARFAAALDVLAPTGSEENLRGVGAWVISPVFIASTPSFWGFSPHVNVGFHVSTNTGKLEHEFFYNVGFDYTPIPRVTFAFDILGRYIVDNERIEAGQAPGGTKIAGNNIVNASMGVKVNVWRDILAVANVLVPININTGLRDQLTWLVGVEAAF